MSQTRIYVVIQKDQKHRLIEAISAAQAIRHCVKHEYSAKVASAKDIAGHMKLGIEVEKASETNDQPQKTGE